VSRVTVGITCYDARDIIARDIASAAAQTWPEIGSLVVHDCAQGDPAEVDGRRGGLSVGGRANAYSHRQAPS